MRPHMKTPALKPQALARARPQALALLLPMLSGFAVAPLTPLWASTVNRPELREALKVPVRANVAAPAAPAAATPVGVTPAQATPAAAADGTPPLRMNEKRLSAQERAELRQQLRRTPGTASLKNTTSP